MKKISIALLCMSIAMLVQAQSAEEKVTSTMKEYHQALVSKNYDVLEKGSDNALTYGHSNGWLQSKAEVINDCKSGLITYHAFKEDSVKVSLSGDAAHVRFIADINSTLRGNMSTNHIKVMEVYLKKGNNWVLFARQAVR